MGSECVQNKFPSEMFIDCNDCNVLASYAWQTFLRNWTVNWTHFLSLVIFTVQFLIIICSFFIIGFVSMCGRGEYCKLCHQRAAEP